jgi:hypothetical protein
LNTVSKGPGGEPAGLRPRQTSGAVVLVLLLVFVVSRPAAQAFGGNQNTYLARALALNHVGLLDADWFAATTTDAFPAFTWLVRPALALWGPAATNGFHALTQAIFLLSALALALRVWPRLRSAAGLAWTGIGLLALYAAIAADIQNRFFGGSLDRFLHTPPGGQYALGPYFQPSECGVLLFAAVAWACWGRWVWAAVFCGAAATLHPSQTLAAGLLTVGFLVATFLDRRPQDARAAIKLGAMQGALTAALVAPMVVATALRFRPESAASLAEAQRVLVHTRMPHHADMATFPASAWVLAIGWVGLAGVLARRTPVAVVLGVAATGSLLLSAAQWVLRRDSLALLFPWRPFGLLQLVASVVVVGAIASAGVRLSERWPWWTARRRAGAFGLMLALFFVTGVNRQLLRWRGEPDTDLSKIIAWAREHRAEGQLYVVPPTLEFEGLRLNAGVPVFVDYKNHPYRDVEVLEWHRRLGVVRAIQQTAGTGNCADISAQLAGIGATHLVLDAGRGGPQAPDCRALRPLTAFGRYSVWERASVQGT